jgi:hypothetical protein
MCSKVLFEFNGGDMCITNYIKRVDMSVAKDEALAADESKRQVSGNMRGQHLSRNEVTEKPIPDERIREFFVEISKTCADEYKIICKVFPVSSIVMKQLIQRIFEQRVYVTLNSNALP